MDILERTWAQINLDNIKHNFYEIKKILKDTTKVMCIVKANAYGHGSTYVAQALQSVGADYLAVSCLSEALEIRKCGVSLPILILGYTDPSEYTTLVKNNITQTVFSYDDALALSRCAVSCKKTLKVHIKIDTGMNRLGFSCNSQNISDTIDKIMGITDMDGLDVEGIFSHFAAADDENLKDFTVNQYQKFINVLDKLSKKGKEFKIRHIANSSAIIDYPEYQLDMVRVGINLYGLVTDEHQISKINLLPAMEVKTIISNLKTVEKETPVSYSCKYVTDKKTDIATVPIGYADGYFRAFTNKAQMLVGGKTARIIGNICMDQTMLDVTGIDCKVGSVVTIIGKDKNETISAYDLAKIANTIPYEIICNISRRVPRVYYENSNLKTVENYLLKD